MPEWEEDEIEELGKNMREVVRQGLKLKAELRARLRHLETVASMPVSYLTSLRPYIFEEEIPEFMEDQEGYDPRSVLGRAVIRKRLSDSQVYYLTRSIAEKSKRCRELTESGTS
ncbi:hypothetical protein EYB45_11025 [Erythrobacteraceae bacterium CFH 75059]|uniref:hypothetical protein n=1 Tax=Qipengyuania thermophila TaxID=2509361 RepID=UPI00101EC876|nr:hypothetical protein [Qipengyuania thermophila]TCD00716.1 hypothetical protein EYB45_11025 [Erythrobacteraceae bacterium CFH 75059]